MVSAATFVSAPPDAPPRPGGARSSSPARRASAAALDCRPSAAAMERSEGDPAGDESDAAEELEALEASSTVGSHRRRSTAGEGAAGAAAEAAEAAKPIQRVTRAVEVAEAAEVAGEAEAAGAPEAAEAKPLVSVPRLVGGRAGGRRRASTSRPRPGSEVPGLYPSEEGGAGAAAGVRETAGRGRVVLDGLAAQLLSPHDHLSQDERTKVEELQQRHKDHLATKSLAAMASNSASATAVGLRTTKSAMKLFERLTPNKKGRPGSDRPGSAPGEDVRPGAAEARAAAAAADVAAEVEAEAKVEEQLQIGEWMHALRNKMAVKEAQLAHALDELEKARLRESDLRMRLEEALHLLQSRADPSRLTNSLVTDASIAPLQADRALRLEALYASLSGGEAIDAVEKLVDAVVAQARDLRAALGRTWAPRPSSPPAQPVTDPTTLAAAAFRTRELENLLGLRDRQIRSLSGKRPNTRPSSATVAPIAYRATSPLSVVGDATLVHEATRARAPGSRPPSAPASLAPSEPTRALVRPPSGGGGGGGGGGGLGDGSGGGGGGEGGHGSGSGRGGFSGGNGVEAVHVHVPSPAAVRPSASAPALPQPRLKSAPPRSAGAAAAAVAARQARHGNWDWGSGSPTGVKAVGPRALDLQTVPPATQLLVAPRLEPALDLHALRECKRPSSPVGLGPSSPELSHPMTLRHKALAPKAPDLAARGGASISMSRIGKTDIIVGLRTPALARTALAIAGGPASPSPGPKLEPGKLSLIVAPSAS